MQFRGHSVVLPDGSHTISDKTPVQNDPRFVSALRTIKALFPFQPFSELSIADYGCFEGGYSIAFALKDFVVIGFEGRKENLDRCRWLKERFSLTNVSFHQTDLEQWQPEKAFSISFVSGLLYHLEDPISFIIKMGIATEKLLILNTHFAEDSIPSRFRHKLSPLTNIMGYQGRWYAESQENSDDPRFPRSALCNRRSFWLTRSSLFSSLKQAGFDLVFEQYDCHHDYEKGLKAIKRNSRSQFVAIKT